MEELIELYTSWKGEKPARVEALAGAGSNRRYYRLYDEAGVSVIGVVGISAEENRTFCYLAEHFGAQHLPVPEILAIADSGMSYLQSDLGDRSLYASLAEGRKNGCYSEEEKELLRKTMAALPDVQVAGARDLDFSRCYPMEEMNFDAVMFDLNYFKFCFLKPTGLDFHEMKLEMDFRDMANDLLKDAGSAFMYRDFQARNVMLDENGNPLFIDFQGGRRGPKEYDVASFLWQASANYSEALRNELLEVYLQSLKKYEAVDEVAFRERLRKFVLFRTLQVLGAYGLRGYFERKKYFLDSIPFAIRNLRGLLEQEVCSYPYLKEVLWQLVQMPQWQESDQEKRTNLVVHVYSFSYRKGIPEDNSGNGGGYVFDCRSIHNPGRYEPYKKLTGLDEPVIRFLEEDGEITEFLKHIYALADAHVSCYLKRGFTDLMFSFGCTGGQHRSVYSAQHVAEYIHQKYGVEVHLCHREQGISSILPPSVDNPTSSMK